MSTTSITVTIIIAIVAAAISAVLLSRIRIGLEASRARDNDRITVNVTALFGVVKYRIHIPMINFRNWQEGITFKKKSDSNMFPGHPKGKEVHLTKDKILNLYERVRLIIKNIFNLLGWMKDAISKVECTTFVWHTHIGVGDAPETAMTTGLVWGVQTSISGLVFQRICLKARPIVQVTPQYNRQTFSTELTANFQIRVSHVAVAGIRLVPHIWKAKGDWRTWSQILFQPRMKSVG